MSTAKPAARETQTRVQPMASRNSTTCFWRWNTPRSSASSANTNRLNRTQKSQFEGMSRVSNSHSICQTRERGGEGGRTWLHVLIFCHRRCLRQRIAIVRASKLAAEYTNLTTAKKILANGISEQEAIDRAK